MREDRGVLILAIELARISSYEQAEAMGRELIDATEGRPAPKLWFKDMVELMKPGSVVVDLAAEQGGNCEYTVPGEAVVQNGVQIAGHQGRDQRAALTRELLDQRAYLALVLLVGAFECRDLVVNQRFEFTSSTDRPCHGIVHERHLPANGLASCGQK